MDVDKLAEELTLSGAEEWLEFFKIKDEHEKAAIEKAKSQSKTESAARRGKRG